MPKGLLPDPEWVKNKISEEDSQRRAKHDAIMIEGPLRYTIRKAKEAIKNAPKWGRTSMHDMEDTEWRQTHKIDDY